MRYRVAKHCHDFLYIGEIKNRITYAFVTAPKYYLYNKLKISFKGQQIRRHIYSYVLKGGPILVLKLKMLPVLRLC